MMIGSSSTTTEVFTDYTPLNDMGCLNWTIYLIQGCMALMYASFVLWQDECDECGEPFDPTYEAYLIHVEPVHLTTTVMDNYITNYDLIVENNVQNMLNQRFKKPNPMKFFPSMLHNNPVTRHVQINRTLNKFVIALDVHIEGKTWYDTLDDVYWGIGTGDPSPKLSWLRYIRWRRYFLHLKLSGITMTEPDSELIQ
jgi:hypothetical protein